MSQQPRKRSFHLTLYLDSRLHHALMKACVESRLSEMYQALKYVVEGVHRDGYLSDQAYNELIEKYSQPLFESEDRPTTNFNSNSELNSERCTYRRALAEFDQYAEDKNWRKVWRRRAERDLDTIPEARELLERLKQYEVSGEVIIEKEGNIVGGNGD